MALLLAPYNDSMRLGMGFNSYTQTMCIDGAVEVTSKNVSEEQSPSQVVTYSSKSVQRLSDIVSSMNISYSSAIQKGTIEVAGNGKSIDEDKIKASDVNIVVSVQVINQTTTLSDSAVFKDMEKVEPGSQAFNDAFGDCYVSGFIKGGDFSSIISYRCIDRTKKDSFVERLKSSSQSPEEAQEFTMDRYMGQSSSSVSSVSKDAEVTISVSWMGGGQIKDPSRGWDVESVYAAAAAFPDKVAKTPQKTWAILTKYKANRSFQAWAMSKSLKPLEYDSVLSYTAELFNNFMEYKQLLKKVQDIITNRDNYEIVVKTNAIPTTISTLVAVRMALRNEMNKIVAVVNTLSRKPELLQQTSSFNVVSKDAIVRKIMEDAISGAPDTRMMMTVEDGHMSDSSTGDFQTIHHADAAIPTAQASSSTAKPVSSTIPAAQGSGSTTKPAPKAPAQEAAPPIKIDLSQLIAPEVWADLLPKRIVAGDIEDTTAAARSAAAALLPPPPPNDNATALLKSDDVSLQIHSAVCGLHDVTYAMRSRVVHNSTLAVKVNEIASLVDDFAYQSLGSNFALTLSILYQYPGGPMRLAAANYSSNSSDTIDIYNKAEYPQVTPTTWTTASWSVVGVVYGGTVFNKDSNTKAIAEAIQKEYNDTGSKYRQVRFHDTVLGQDPLPNKVKSGVIFYRAEDNDKAPILAAVGIDNTDPAKLTTRLQLLSLERVVEKEVTKTVEKEVTKIVYQDKEVPPPPKHMDATQPPSKQLWSRGTLRIYGSMGEPFATAGGTMNFCFRTGPIEAISRTSGVGVFEVGSGVSADKAVGLQLNFESDGNLCAYLSGSKLWESATSNRGMFLLLQEDRPQIQIVDAELKKIWPS